MSLFFLFVFFVLGAIVASFVGVVAARLNTGESIIHGRSRCDACGATLGVIDLVPLLSYVIFGGRARCCRSRISYWAPLTELMLGILYAISYSMLGFVLALPLFLIALALLLALVLYDLTHMILPPVLLWLFGIAAALFALAAAPDFQSFLIVAAISFVIGLVILLMHVLSRGRAMGLADAPLTFALALLAGPSALAGFAYSFWIGAVIGIVILFGRPRGSRMGVEVPFAPFLAIGFLLAFFIPWNPFVAVSLLLGASR